MTSVEPKSLGVLGPLSGASALRRALRSAAEFERFRTDSTFLVLAASLAVAACMPKCKEPACPEPRTAVAMTPEPAAGGPVKAAARASASAIAGKVITPEGSPDVAWTDEELGKDVAIKTVRQTDAASYHVVRLLKAEKPHVHDRSDLTVFVLSGSVNMHFVGRVVPVGPGQVIDVPKGAFHWAENASAEPSFAYVVFTPAFDGKDRRFVNDPSGAPGGSH